MENVGLSNYLSRKLHFSGAECSLLRVVTWAVLEGPWKEWVQHPIEWIHFVRLVEGFHETTPSKDIHFSISLGEVMALTSSDSGGDASKWRSSSVMTGRGWAGKYPSLLPHAPALLSHCPQLKEHYCNTRQEDCRNPLVGTDAFVTINLSFPSPVLLNPRAL